MEVCDDGASGSTELGACNPECTGFYSRKTIRRSIDVYGTNLGGIAGADAICAGDFGSGWKALLVGGTRRATVTPFVGDGQQDWVLHEYTYYFNEDNEFIWRTDTVALLGASNARQQALFAPLFDPLSEPGGRYPWSGYRLDWTTIEGGTCNGWTSTDRSNTGGFITETLQGFAQEFCNATPYQFILCAEQ